MIRKLLAVALLSLPAIATAGERESVAASADTQYCVTKVDSVRSAKGLVWETTSGNVGCKSDMNGRASHQIAGGVFDGHNKSDDAGQGRSNSFSSAKAFH